MGVDVSIVLPCRDEEKSIGICIKAIKNVMSSLKYSYEIIVSDSSKDSSPSIARRLGAKVVKHDLFGYGNALMEGFKAAKGRIVVMADADNTYNFNEIPKFLEAIKKEDFVIGSRFRGEIKKGAMPFFHKYLGNPVLTFILRLFFRAKVSDAHCGFRAIKKKTLEKLELNTTGMEFASEMIIKAVKKGLKIKEIPITYHPRIGKSKMNSLRDGWKHLRFMLLFSPTYLFFIPGIIILLLGIWQLFSNAFLGLILAVCGYQVIMLGLFSKTYAITRLGEQDKITEIIINNISIEKGILFSIVLIIISLLLKSQILFSLILLIGILSFFNVFFLSILGIGER